jgi:hypothetical protein
MRRSARQFDVGLLKRYHERREMGVQVWAQRRVTKENYFVGLEVFTAVTMKNAVFWDVAPCRCEREQVAAELASSAATCSRGFFARGFFYPEDGGDTILRNVG